MRSGQVCYTFVWQIRAGDYLYPVFVANTENEEVLTAEQRNLEYWNDMALKGTIYQGNDVSSDKRMVPRSGKQSGRQEDSDGFFHAVYS